MKNVTITLADDLAAWARVEAAKAGKSLSRYLADRLDAARRGSPRSQAETMERLKALPLLDLTDKDGRAPQRETLRERRRLR
jgi:hypothetical protein